MTSSLSGVLVALATPFSADGSVDEATLRALVDRTIDGGVHGVVACGSTGEFSALTSDERRLVVETVVDQTARRVPVIAQTGLTARRRRSRCLATPSRSAPTSSCRSLRSMSHCHWPRPCITCAESPARLTSR